MRPLRSFVADQKGFSAEAVPLLQVFYLLPQADRAKEIIPILFFHKEKSRYCQKKLFLLAVTLDEVYLLDAFDMLQHERTDAFLQLLRQAEIYYG